jgi:hypothetical protein
MEAGKGQRMTGTAPDLIEVIDEFNHGLALLEALGIALASPRVADSDPLEALANVVSDRLHGARDALALYIKEHRNS